MATSPAPKAAAACWYASGSTTSSAGQVSMHDGSMPSYTSPSTCAAAPAREGAEAFGQWTHRTWQHCPRHRSPAACAPVSPEASCRSPRTCPAA
eukprot:7032684-Prymnesium_polylepis.1